MCQLKTVVGWSLPRKRREASWPLPHPSPGSLRQRQWGSCKPRSSDLSLRLQERPRSPGMGVGMGR